MKYSIFFAGLAVAGLSLASCDEFPPVKYDDPQEERIYTEEDFAGYTFVSIADLKDMYQGTPVEIDSDIMIAGQVISSDQSGNLYRTMYIQDDAGGIELKLGTRNLYNEYKIGQWVYVNCNGLTLGDYRGMVGLGYRSLEDKYETSYIEVPELVNSHVFKGKLDKPIEPRLLEESQLRNEEFLGTYVRIEDLSYGNQIFVLLYYDPNGDREDYEGNCLFLDDDIHAQYGNCGIDTWAMSETGFYKYLADGFGGAVPEEDKSRFVDGMAYSVSQYFKKGSVNVEVRTSGYARFADTRIDQQILDGAHVNFTGILTRYDDKCQFTLLDLNGVEIITETDGQ